jgi:hypothetical protein
VILKGLAANCEATDSEEFSALLKVRLGTEVIFGACNSARVLVTYSYDPKVINKSNLESKTPSRVTHTCDNI